MISNNTKSILAYSFLKGVGTRSLNKLIHAAEQIGKNINDVFESGNFSNLSFTNEQIKDAYIKADEQADIAMSLGHEIISKLDEEYPDSLRCIDDAPPFLFCSGNIELLKKDSVSIIGTRSPTLHGRIIAERVTTWFTKNDWVITSGLAKGVDTIAHQACLSNSGETISVLAHGLEKIYPAVNKKLANNIIECGGLLISEYKYNSYVGKANFVERDRIQAALSKAVVLVQSDIVGGSLHASRASIKYGRYLVVLGQSERDISRNEVKIGANILLEKGSISEKLKLLNIAEDGIDNILIVPNKDKLEWVNSKVRSVSFCNSRMLDSKKVDLFN